MPRAARELGRARDERVRGSGVVRRRSGCLPVSRTRAGRPSARKNRRRRPAGAGDVRAAKSVISSPTRTSALVLHARARPDEHAPLVDARARPRPRADDVADGPSVALAHDPAQVRSRASASAEALDDAAIAVEAHAIAGLQRARDAVDVHDARHAELARDDGRVAKRTAELRHDARGDAEERRPARRRWCARRGSRRAGARSSRRGEEDARAALRRRRSSRRCPAARRRPRAEAAPAAARR